MEFYFVWIASPSARNDGRQNRLFAIVCNDGGKLDCLLLYASYGNDDKNLENNAIEKNF